MDCSDSGESERHVRGRREGHRGAEPARSNRTRAVSASAGPDGEAAPELTQELLKAALDRKVIMLACGPYGSIIRMIPALVITDAEIERLLTVWREALSEVCDR
jgi:4-aminobutyrate aminotransferase